MAVNYETTGHTKYCSNQTAIQAFEANDFRCVERDIKKWKEPILFLDTGIHVETFYAFTFLRNMHVS